jgi:hypothetical protein
MMSGCRLAWHLQGYVNSQTSRAACRFMFGGYGTSRFVEAAFTGCIFVILIYEI